MAMLVITRWYWFLQLNHPMVVTNDFTQNWDPSANQVGLHGRTPGRGEKIQEIQEGQGESGWGCHWEKTNWTWRILSPKAK